MPCPGSAALGTGPPVADPPALGELRGQRSGCASLGGDAMLTRRDMLRQAGRTAAVLTTTAPWWLVRRAHAARDKKLVVWVPTALAPQVDKILQEQCYAYAKQAGIKESELDYSILGAGQMLPKLVASLEAGNPPDLAQIGPALAALYHS